MTAPNLAPNLASLDPWECEIGSVGSLEVGRGIFVGYGNVVSEEHVNSIVW